MNHYAYTPTIRAALMAALATPSHTLRRIRGGFVSGKPIQRAPVSRRCANQLERDGLFAFDNAAFPSAITLTREGLEAARQLQATNQPKASTP